MEQKTFKLQKALTAEVELLKKEIDFESFTTEQKARTLSQSQCGSSAAKVAIPTTRQLSLPPTAHQINSKLQTDTLTLPHANCVYDHHFSPATSSAAHTSKESLLGMML